MRSKTSFFNRTLCLSAIRRFWPLWAAYFGIWFLSLPLPMYRHLSYSSYTYADYLTHVYNLARIEGMILGAVFSVFSAMAVWSFLYNARSVSGMACLPVRREGQFFSALLAGFLPLAAGNLLTAALTLPCCLMAHLDPYPILGFFAVTTLICLFFFGFATLCAFLTGHILALPAVYGVLNFTAAAVEYLLLAVLGRFVYGLDISPTMGRLSALWLSPPIGMLRYTEVYVDYQTYVYQGARLPASATSTGFTGWGCLLGYAAAGLVCMALALLLFRRRKLESAGDVVAVDFLRPVFRWCMALGCGLVLACFMEFIIFDRGYNDSSAFLTLLIFFLLGAFIGWFSGEMLIKKSFRVFKGRTWAGFGVCCAVILVLMLGMRFDLFGYERRVPETGSVRSAEVYAGGSSSTLKAPENLERLTALHRDIVADKETNTRFLWTGFQGGISTVACRITYTLNNGRTLSRYYNLAYDYADPERMGEAAALQDLLNTREAIASRNSLPLAAEPDAAVLVYITAAMTLEECATLRGCGDAEEFLLTWYAGYSTREARTMAPEKRRLIIQELLDNTGTYAYENFLGWQGKEYSGPQDLEGVYVYHTFTMEERDARALYQDCLEPDLTEGGIGEIRFLTTRSEETALYEVNIDFLFGRGNSLREAYSGELIFTPTTRSTRTNAWLREHGIALHTAREVAEAAGRLER